LKEKRSSIQRSMILAAPGVAAMAGNPGGLGRGRFATIMIIDPERAFWGLFNDLRPQYAIMG
jgi:hypothetical protein